MSHDIIIVGGGIVGAAAALSLAKATSLKIAVIDTEKKFQSWEKKSYHPRVSAISPASQRLFQSLGVWEKITAKRISSYLRMDVWEDQGSIQFDHEEVLEPSLGYIIEDVAIRESLHEKFSDFSAIDFLHPVQLKKIEKNENKIILHASDERKFSAKLLVAADGARSWVREQLNIPVKEHEYGHTAIVATVKTTKPHEKTAYQRFMPLGPLAFLPLNDPYYSSIVWSTTDAESLIKLNDKDFCEALSEAFEYKLGDVIETQTRYSFPLYRRHAEHYVEEGIALIGDAAHTLHPLAGQGVNLGLLDAAALTEVIKTALEKNRNYASLATLRRYERERKSENAIMIALVGALKQLFESENTMLKAIRGKGLTLVNRLSPLKRWLMGRAVGEV